MKRLLFAKYINDSTGGYEYYFYGTDIFSSESLSESEVEILLHLVQGDVDESSKCN